MTNNIIAYVGGDHPKSPEDGQAHMAKYMEWIKNLGDAAVEPANPLPNSKIVSKSGVADADPVTSMSGYTIVNVADLDAALDIAKACPFLDIDGTLQVAEIKSMG